MRTMANEILIKNAIRAIQEVHSDTSVPLETTLSSLELLSGEIEICIDAMREDIRRAQKDEDDGEV